MSSTAIASKSVAKAPSSDLLSQIGAFVRSFYAATPAAIFINAVATMNGVPGARRDGR